MLSSASVRTPRTVRADRLKTSKTRLNREVVVAIDKIVGLIGIAVAILSAFVAIPHVFLILVIAGLIVGFWVASADHVRLIVTAFALVVFAGTFVPAPYVGKYIGAILNSGGNLAMGAALMAILRNLYEWFRPAPKTAAS
jgi:hypothetical protein